MDKNKAIDLLSKQIKSKVYSKSLKQYMQREEFKDSYQRLRLLKEVIATERSYVTFLSQLILEYYTPLKTNDKKNNYFDEKEFQDVFSNIEEIKRVNSVFLKELEKEYKKFPMAYLGNVFKNNANEFRIYTKYVNNYPNATETFKNCLKNNKKLNQFLESKSKEKINNMNFFLIMPVQSIIFLFIFKDYQDIGKKFISKKYKTECYFLVQFIIKPKDILKNTEKGHVEYEGIKQSLEIIKEIAKSVNDSKKEMDNQNTIKDLIQNFKGKYNISTEVNRELSRELSTKFSFSTLKINEENYKIMIFTDIFVLIDKNSVKRRNFIFFYLLSNIIEKSLLDLKLEVIYNNQKEVIQLSFSSENENNDINDFIILQTEQQNLLLLNKGILININKKVN
jgi:hypothetical protein